jgi:hypothetical protein
MDEIRLPQHVVNRFERRWTAEFARWWESGNVWSARLRSNVLEGSLTANKA